jgi:HEAT repeat protein
MTPNPTSTSKRGTGSLDEQKAWDKYFTYLINALNDADANARLQAARMLGEHGEPQAVEALSNVLMDDPDMGVRQVAAAALGKLGASEPLIRALRVPDIQVRQLATQALGQIGDPRAIEPLILALRDSNAEVRNQVAFALNKIGGPAVEPLITALSHPDPVVRWGASRILGSIGDARALPELERLARDDNTPVSQSNLPDSIKGTRPLNSVAQAAWQATEKIKQRGGKAG